MFIAQQRARPQLIHKGSEHACESDYAEQEEVEGQQQVDVLFGEYLKYDINAEQGDTGYDWEEGDPVALACARLLLPLLMLHRFEAAHNDGYESHDDQTRVGD